MYTIYLYRYVSIINMTIITAFNLPVYYINMCTHRQVLSYYIYEHV